MAYPSGHEMPRSKAGGGYCQDSSIDHREIIARRETICGIQNIGLSPSTELLAKLDSYRSVAPGDTQAGHSGALRLAIQVRYIRTPFGH